MSTLQELLNLGLVEIGSDDSRLAKMQNAATAFVKHLSRNPELIIPATLIAIDCEASEDEPILTLVDTHLVNEWKTIRNTHTNSPRELLRSIIIQALSVLATDKAEMAALIWQTAFSPICHNQARLGREREVVRKLLQGFQERAEHEAIARARIPEPPRKNRRAAKPIPFTELKGGDFLRDIGRSAGPHDASGTAFEDPNPHWPNSGHPWSYEFAPRMATSLVKAVNAATKQVLAPINRELQTQRNELEKRWADHVESLLEQTSRSAQLDVLWWSEAKYSPSVRLGYREMHGAAAAVLMAHDLSALVPAMAPASVTYVLGETVRAIWRHDSKPEPWRVESLFEALHTNTSELRRVVAGIGTTEGRAPLFEVVAEAVHGNRVTGEQVSGRTGIDSELEISLPDFSMWMFRDIQARRLVEELK